MSFEKFPIKEKRATDLDAQIAWLVREMGYSRDKVKGYEEKRVRLARDPSDETSVFGFLSGYWHRFRQANNAIAEVPRQEMADRALQAGAKVVAGLSDKVAFSFWLEDQITGAEHDPEWLIDTALGMIRDKVKELSGMYTDDELVDLNDKPFEENPMGAAILELHEVYRTDSDNTARMRDIAINGSAAGVIMWRAYARSLEEHGFSSVMPKPGLSSGNIEPWE